MAYIDTVIHFHDTKYPRTEHEIREILYAVFDDASRTRCGFRVRRGAVARRCGRCTCSRCTRSTLTTFVRQPTWMPQIA